MIKKISQKKRISEKDIKLFAEASGDYNPIHLDHEYAKNSFFKKRIAHGLLTGSHVSALIANELPGPGSIYLSQTFKFLKPVFIDQEVTTCISIDDLDKNIYYLDCKCFVGDELVLEGKAKVLKP